MGHYTDAPEDNLLGLTSKEALNEHEALGVATAERYLLEEVDYPVDFSVALVQDLHRRAFGHLYDWAGQWRRTVPNVGAYVPPAAARVPQLLYEWADEVRHRQQQFPAEPTPAHVAELLAYAHHRLVAIHPLHQRQRPDGPVSDGPARLQLRLPSRGALPAGTGRRAHPLPGGDPPSGCLRVGRLAAAH